MKKIKNPPSLDESKSALNIYLANARGFTLEFIEFKTSADGANHYFSVHGLEYFNGKIQSGEFTRYIATLTGLQAYISNDYRTLVCKYAVGVSAVESIVEKLAEVLGIDPKTINTIQR